LVQSANRERFPAEIIDSDGYLDVEDDTQLKLIDGYSQSSDSFHINKGGVSHLDGYIPLPANSGEIGDILGSQNKKGE